MKKKVEKENQITALYCRLSVDDIQRDGETDNRRNWNQTVSRIKSRYWKTTAKRTEYETIVSLLTTVSPVRPLNAPVFRKWRK